MPYLKQSKVAFFPGHGVVDVSYTSIILSCIRNETNILKVFDPCHEWDNLIHFTCYGLKSSWEGGLKSSWEGGYSDWF